MAYQTHTQYGISIQNDNKIDFMSEHFCEFRENESDEQLIERSFNYIYGWIGLTDGFDYQTQECVVFNPLAIFEGNAQQPGDYVIKQQLNTFVPLFARKKDLSFGDVLMNNLGVMTITFVHRILKNPLNDQQYYRFRLVGGPKFDQFQKDKESVAQWKAGRWMWKGANDE